MLDLGIYQRRPAASDPDYDPHDAVRRRIGGSRMAAYPVAGIRKEIQLYPLHPADRDHLVALAPAPVFHPGCGAIRAELLLIRDQCFRAELRTGKHPESHPQRVAVHPFPLYHQFPDGDLFNPSQSVGEYRIGNPVDGKCISGRSYGPGKKYPC